MFRFGFLLILCIFWAGCAKAQLEGAMIVQGSVPEPEKPLTIAGVSESDAEKMEQVSQVKSEKKGEEFDEILYNQIKRSGVYRNPLIVKQIYAHYKAVELAVRQEHLERLKQIPEEDKEAYEKEKRKLDVQTPVRFNLFEDSDEEINELINQNPELAMYFIMKNVSHPRYSDMTKEEQEEYIKRTKIPYKTSTGYLPEEYLQKYVETKIQEREQFLKGQKLMDDSVLREDGQFEESKEKK